MKDLDERDTVFESHFGLMSGWFLFCLHELSTVEGANWDFSDPDTIEIIVTKQNADAIYGNCREIRSGYSVGLTKKQMKKIKEARSQAHKFLYDEANDPNTPIERKIELVKLTGKDNW